MKKLKGNADLFLLLATAIMILAFIGFSGIQKEVSKCEDMARSQNKPFEIRQDNSGTACYIEGKLINIE